MSGLRASPFALAGPRHPRTHRGDRPQCPDRAGRVRGDRALPVRPFPRVDADGRPAHPRSPTSQFTYEVTEPGVPYPIAELRAQHGHRGAHSPPPRRTAGRGLGRSRSCTTSRARTPPTAKRWAARCASVRPGADSSCPRSWPTRPSTPPIPRPDASRRNTWSPPTCPALRALSERVAELTSRLLPTGQCSAEAIADQLAMHPRTLQRRLAAEGVRCQDIIDR